MSVCISLLPVALPAGINLAGGLMLAVAAATARVMNMEVKTEQVAARTGNRVTLSLGNAGEVTAGSSAGQSIVFTRDDITVTFSQDAQGQTGVTVHGERSEEELRAFGEQCANRLMQQYAYHRLVTEMKSRHMNVVEEEVEQDGTVRMLVRVYQE